jgi:hypothetical protein
MHNVLDDGLGGQQHHNAEDEGADGVSKVPAGVILVVPDQGACNSHPDALQDVANDVQHCTA